jgi:hypothetical protein
MKYFMNIFHIIFYLNIFIAFVGRANAFVGRLTKEKYFTNIF